MDFLKKHYEKILLGVVLVGLAVGAGLLPWMISSERALLEAKAAEITNRQPKPLPEPDFSEITNLLQRCGTPMTLDLSTGNKVFNPANPWQRRPDGTMSPLPTGKGIGPEAVLVTKLTPLYTIFALDTVMTSDAGPRYMIGITREAAAKPADRGKKTTGASLNEKNKEGFTIREVKGVGDATELVLELADTTERVTVSKLKPFKRTDGYMADLKYPPDNRAWSNQRVGSRVRIGGDDYNLVAIAANEVVLSAPSGKKTSRPINPGP